jgi:hypothetical protein
MRAGGSPRHAHPPDHEQRPRRVDSARGHPLTEVTAPRPPPAPQAPKPGPSASWASMLRAGPPVTQQPPQPQAPQTNASRSKAADVSPVPPSGTKPVEPSAGPVPVQILPPIRSPPPVSQVCLYRFGPFSMVAHSVPLEEKRCRNDIATPAPVYTRMIHALYPIS